MGPMYAALRFITELESIGQTPQTASLLVDLYGSLRQLVWDTAPIVPSAGLYGQTLKAVAIHSRSNLSSL